MQVEALGTLANLSYESEGSQQIVKYALQVKMLGDMRQLRIKLCFMQGVVSSVDHGDVYPALKTEALAVLQNLSARDSCLGQMVGKLGGAI